jgi:LruC domain-containing protein
VVNLPDRDGDGIDDPYDAFPDDPELAFTRSIPASGQLTVAFEDNFPALGDADFNDFVATYHVVEYRNAKNKLVQLKGTASAVARGASFDHAFGLLIDHPGTPVSASVVYRDGTGNVLRTVAPVLTEPLNVELFTSTIGAFDRPGGVTMDNVSPFADPSVGHVTDFSITYAKDASEVSADIWAPYNPYLRVLTNTDLGYIPDIHLIGRSALPDSENPAGYEDFRDPVTGSPWAILVPNDWLWPRESRPITIAYPDFVGWRDSLGASNPDWFFHPDADYVVTR